jgi:putative membrane protein
MEWAINTLAVFVAAYIVPGFHYDTFPALLAAALILGILNAFLKPLLWLLALPLLIVTLGFFFLVINALLLWFVGSLVKGFHVESFWPAFWGGLVIAILTGILNSVAGLNKSRVVIRRGGSPSNRRDDDGPVIDV